MHRAAVLQRRGDVRDAVAVQVPGGGVPERLLHAGR
jgi:hypothetical protein